MFVVRFTASHVWQMLIISGAHGASLASFPGLHAQLPWRPGNEARASLSELSVQGSAH